MFIEKFKFKCYAFFAETVSLLFECPTYLLFDIYDLLFTTLHFNRMSEAILFDMLLSIIFPYKTYYANLSRQ